jgi:transposase
MIYFFCMGNQSDARKLDAAELVHVRRSLVQAVRGGMRQTEAAGVFGVSLRAANKWVALDKVGGLRALKLKRRGRRSGDGRLSAARANRIRQMIVDAPPDQLKLPFYLWTRAAVVNLIEREYEIAVSLTTVGRYLRSWGMCRQKPLRRMCERGDAAATARWLRHNYPAIARRAKQEGAVICWGAETALRATAQRFGGNMISAITNRGHLVFMVLHGKFDGSQFVQFMQRLLRQFSGNIFLIVDCHPVHRSVLARQFVATRAKQVHLIRVPGYCREKYLDEVLDQQVESKALGESRPSKGGGPMAGVSVRQVFNPVAAG